MSDDKETVKGLLSEGLNEEKRKIEFALKISNSKIKEYEGKYGISTTAFIEKFGKGEIDENDETFEWWSETKLADELKEKLETIENIEICQ